MYVETPPPAYSPLSDSRSPPDGTLIEGMRQQPQGSMQQAIANGMYIDIASAYW